MDFSGLSSNDSLEREYRENGGKFTEEKFPKESFLINSLEVSNVYKKDFDSIEDAFQWVENTLDLTKNWHIKRV